MLPQREPTLPLVTASRPPLCAVLDCCVLWLKHNLHMKLEVQSYMCVPIALHCKITSHHYHSTCIWILHRTVWFLSRTKRRLGLCSCFRGFGEVTSDWPQRVSRLSLGRALETITFLAWLRVHEASELWKTRATGARNHCPARLRASPCRLLPWLTPDYTPTYCKCKYTTFLLPY